MKNILSSLMLIAILSFVSQTAYSQDFPYQEYQTRTLSELTELLSITEKSGDNLIQSKPDYSAIRVKYTGKSRPISAEKMELFKQWQELLSIDIKTLDLLKDEYLFTECDKQYWIPVQKQVAAYFPKELKSEDRITLYLMAVGGIKIQNEWEFVFLTNEFKK